MKAILHSIGEIRSSRPLLINKPTIPIHLVLTSFILVFCFMFAAKAQELPVQRTPVAKAVAEITPLNIGDKIPDELWEMYFPVVSTASDQEQYLSLGDFKDKLIILDFWATWCAPCISSLHKLDTLQKEFEGDLMVIATSDEPAKKNRDFFLAKGWDLPTMFNETTLKGYFPHRAIPHQVWIKDGTVIAIPKAHYATTENISKVLKKEALEMKMVLDSAPFDNTKPLFMNGNGGRSGNKFYYSMVSNYAPDLPQKNGLDRLWLGDTTVLAVHNWTIRSLYYEAYKDDVFEELVNESGIYWEVSDSLSATWPIKPDSKNFENTYEADLAHEGYLNEIWYSYNLWYPKKLTIEEARVMMQEDLNRYFGIEKNIVGKIENRPKKFLVLSLLGRKEETAEKLMKSTNSISGNEEDFYIKENYVFSGLKSRLRLARLSPSQLIDRTGFKNTDPVSFIFSKRIDNNLSIAQKELAKYGLKLSEEEWEVPVLILREKTNLKSR